MPDIRDLSKARVVVVGDVMIDRWCYGRVDRISPEAPVPVFVFDEQKELPGGAANVEANLKALGCEVRLIGRRLWPSIKIRFVAGQQIFRVDHEDKHPWDAEEREELYRLATATKPQALIISDYGKGVCTPDLCRRLIKWAKEHAVKVIVDPKGTDWGKYTGCDVITPNELEWRSGGDNCGQALLITRGANGMSLFREGYTVVEIPAVAREVFDVTGAGDTVVAILAAAMAVGFDLSDAARLANAAAGVVVGKRGTATCDLDELERALHPPYWLKPDEVVREATKPIVGVTKLRAADYDKPFLSLEEGISRMLGK